MLFELNTLRAVVIVIEFLVRHIGNFWKRIFYNYYLRDMSIASIELPLGLGLLAFGVFFGAFQWIESWQTGATSTAGTVMLSALPVIMGMQLVLAFLDCDMSSRPSRPLQRRAPSNAIELS